MSLAHYHGSKGPVPIASMNPHHLAAAHAKLVRERKDASRDAEIAAMADALDAMPAEDEPEPAPAPVGHNMPPETPAGEAIFVHAADLYAEAKHWLDGATITSDGEAEAVDRLLSMAREAFAVADAQRVRENEPFDSGKAAVQAKFAPLIADTKKTTGTLVRMQQACLAALGPWRKAKLDAANAIAEAARKEAAQKAAEAAEAMRASTADLDAREAAEALVQAAQEASQAAARAERATTTGTGLTTYYEAVMTGQKEAILHYMKDQPAEFIALAQRLADQDVRGGKRSIPGFSVEERKRAR